MANGVVVALGAGSAQVTAARGSDSGAAIFTVLQAVDSMVFAGSPDTITVGDTASYYVILFAGGTQVPFYTRNQVWITPDSARIRLTYVPFAAQVIAVASGTARLRVTVDRTTAEHALTVLP